MGRRHQDELAQLTARRAKRSNAPRVAVQTRRSETMHWAAQTPLQVNSLPRDLEQQVCDYYGAKRIDGEQMVEFVRWRYSNYPILVKALAKRTGAAEARQLLKERIDEMIRDSLGDLKSQNCTSFIY